MSAGSHPPFVVGLDGSTGSIVALGAARELGACVGAPLVAVFVRHHPGALGVSATATHEHRLALDSMTADIEAETLTYLADYPWRWTFETRDGDPGGELIAAAAAHAACLVVVGHRGHNPVAERIVGSVAAGLVHRCPVSVLVAR
jgi:nucleotide-binding universal stress UspA family protein